MAQNTPARSAGQSVLKARGKERPEKLQWTTVPAHVLIGPWYGPVWLAEAHPLVGTLVHFCLHIKLGYSSLHMEKPLSQN